MAQLGSVSPEVETLPKGTVVIAGGGPVGLLVAKTLSHYGVKSVLFERNKTTTKWPKMDLTNARSMEIFRRLGLSQGLREIGVAAYIDQPVLVSSGLPAKEAITKWDLPGADRFDRQIRECNDGTQPLESWQRLSQVLFERYLKALCDEDPLISVRFGCKVDEIEEADDHVRSTVVDINTDRTTIFISDYVVGCDGASSKVRQSMKFPLDGGPIPACVLLVHFKSTDLSRLHKQGQFWHIFLVGPPGELRGAIIAQNEKDIWTTHMFLPLDADTDSMSSEEAVYRVLGGLYGEYRIKIDEILVRSTWRPTIAVARTWCSSQRRVLIAGDAAHQHFPTGGYGMNMGIGDAFDVGWKLAAVINGYAGETLLQSYEDERRPVALRNVERSGVHFDVHTQMKDIFAGGDPRRIDEDTEEGRALRQRVQEHYQTHDGENKDMGIEMDYRYTSEVIVPDPEGQEPEWSPSRYTPSTWPGARCPHLFLSGGTPMFDLFGKDWTMISFHVDSRCQDVLVASAKRFTIPVTVVNLPQEGLARKLYEKPLVLVRPDGHVAWRGEEVRSGDEADRIWRTVVGKADLDMETEAKVHQGAVDLRLSEKFTGTMELTTQVDTFGVERMGEFQQ